MTRLVINQLGGFRNIWVSVFGITVAGLGVLDIERGIDLVADDFGEGYDFDVVCQIDIHCFAVGDVEVRSSKLSLLFFSYNRLQFVKDFPDNS